LETLTSVKEGVKDDIKLLKPETQEKIRDIFHTALTKANMIGGEIATSDVLA
jgi:hypothetical protein